MRPLILLTLVLILAGATWWALTPPPNSIDDPTQILAEQVLDASPAQADTSANQSGSIPIAEAPPASQDRDELVAGHRIQVLDVDGQPAPDVAVTVWPDQEEPSRFAEHAARLTAGELPGTQQVGNAPRTGKDGMVTLTTAERCFVWATIEGATGFVHAQASPDGGSAELHVLQLHAAPMVEIIVLDSAGDEVRGQLDFGAHVGSATALDLQPKDMRPGDYGSAWAQSMSQICTFGDGRRMLGLVPPKHVRDRIGPDPGTLRFRLSFTHHGIQYPPREFEDDVVGPIVYQLPDTGTLLIHLKGHPEGFVPGISAADANGRTRMGKAVEGSEGASWLFDPVPLGEEWELMYWSQLTEGSGLSPNYFPPRRIPGPTVAGEQNEQTIEFSWPAGFHGRLVLPDEAGLSWKDVHSTQAGRRFDGKFYFDRGNQPEDWCRLGVLADGSFHLALDPERGAHRNFAGIASIGIFIDIDQQANGNGAEIPPKMWAFIETSLDSSDASVDLGDVQLKFRDPLLAVRVIDEQGNPLSDAGVSVSFAADWEHPSMARETFMPMRTRAAATNANGETWFIASDWETSTGYFQNGTEQQPGFKIHRLRVTAAHPDAVQGSVELAPHVRQIEIRLTGAATLGGSALPFRKGEQISAVLLPAGATLDNASELGVSHTYFHGGRATEELVDFKFAAVPMGTWDAVFFQPFFGKIEIHRVRAIQVEHTGEVREPRLQRIDFSDAIGEIRLRLFREGGGRLTPEEISEGEFRLSRTTSDGGSWTSPAKWDRDEIFLVLPASAEVDFSVHGRSWSGTRMNGVSAGVHDVYLKELNECRLQISNYQELPDGVELSLRLRSDEVIGRNVMRGNVKSSEVAVFFEHLGTYSARWRLSKPDAGWGESFNTEVSVTGEMLQAGGALELAIPAELLAAIPD